MASDTRRLQESDPARRGYPQLDQPTLARLNETLAELVSLLHGADLSDVQRQELTASLAVQTANCEALHRIRLRNSDEPAFMVQLNRTPGDD